MTGHQLMPGGGIVARFRNRRFARTGVRALCATLGATGLVVLTGSSAAADTCVTFPGGQRECTFTGLAPESWTVPAGVTRLTSVYLRGGDGGNGSSLAGDASGGAGGLGGETHATNFPVTPGSTITFYIGDVGGIGGGCGNAPGGAGGLSGGVTPAGAVGGAGGDGGNGIASTERMCAGGGGGGGTFMMAGTAQPGEEAPLLAAGGGGGGGGVQTGPIADSLGGFGGGDGTAAAGGQAGAAGGGSGDTGGNGGTDNGVPGKSNGSNGGPGIDAPSATHNGGGGGGGGYCGGGGGGNGSPEGGGGGGGEGFDQGDTATADPCAISSVYETASIPGRPGSTERNDRAQGTVAGRAVITYRAPDGFEQPPLPSQGRDVERRGKGKAQCTNDPGRDAAKDPRTRKCKNKKKRKGGLWDIERPVIQMDRRSVTF